MKVLHLGKFYPPARGGIETILKLVCDRTSPEVRNRVLVANHRTGGMTERDGDTDVVRLSVLKKIGAVAFCPAMPVRLAGERADLIVIHEPNPMALVSYFLARPAGKLIVWFHSEVIRPSWLYRVFYRPFLHFALSRASRIIVASPTLADSTPQLRGWRSKCAVIPYGIDVDDDTSTDVAQQADAIGRRYERPIVLFVGRLVKYKGVDVLLEAMRDLPAVALIVGDGPERAALARQAEVLGVADRCRFLGEVPDEELAALYRACDIFVLPSVTRQEAFGVVQLEAMARGKAIICTDLGTGTGWVNQHGDTGLVVPPRDASALHAAIAELLANPDRRHLFGAAGARRVRAIFTVDRMIAAVLSLYRDVMDEDERKAVA
ncbi:MAG: glycosyltransferase [Vicinamibacterales bacterium]|nr:glycosyltransferase [Vicinamibacterales bacterium]